jgi:hypothetical protein
MKTKRACYECLRTDTHTDWCVSRGYAAVGPHPQAPPREAAPTERPGPGAAGALEMCCGGTCVRALCFIHSTEPKQAPATPDYEAFDLAPGASTLVARARALAAPPAGWRLLGPDDPEVSSDLIYATPDGGVVGVPPSTSERWAVGDVYPDGVFRPGTPLFQPSYATQEEAEAARQAAADRLGVYVWCWDIRRLQ